jgi:hypothetical protein
MESVSQLLVEKVHLKVGCSGRTYPGVNLLQKVAPSIMKFGGLIES